MSRGTLWYIEVMDTKTLRKQYFVEQSQFFKILGSPIKLQILHFISFAPRTVEDCAHKFLQSVQNTSLHLIALQKAGILEVLKVKNFRYYYLAQGEKQKLVTKALKIDSTSLIAQENLWTSGLEKLLDEVKERNLALVDLRSAEEINHIPVKNVLVFEDEVSSLPQFLKEQSEFSQFVLICKGRMCERLAASVNICLSEKLKVKGLILAADELLEFSLK